MLIEHTPLVMDMVTALRKRCLEVFGVVIKVTVEEIPVDTSYQQMDLIADIVCEVFRVSRHDIESKKTNRETGLVDARHTLFYISHKIKGFPCPKVAKYYGRKDHSTVLNGCGKIKGFIDVNDPIVIKVYEAIEKVNAATNIK